MRSILRVLNLALLICATCCSWMLASAVAAAPAKPQLKLKLAKFDPLLAAPQLPAKLRLESASQAGYFIVQFNQPTSPAVLAKLRATGARPLQYLPDQAYLMRLSPGQTSAVRSLPEVRWVGPIQPGWKIAPDLGSRSFSDPQRRDAGLLVVTADLFEGEEIQQVAAEISSLGVEIIQTSRFGETRRLKLRATRPQVEQIAALAAVAWIEEVGEITLRNNTARWVAQSNQVDSTTVWDHGLHGEGQVLGHIDVAMDMTSCYFRDALNNTPGPAHRKVVAYRSNSGPGAAAHGTHTAGTLAGDQFPINGSTLGNGHAYAARISHTNLNDITGSGTESSNLYETLAAAHADGARLHSNSWGDDFTTAYTTWCQDIDQFSYDFEDSLVLFAVSNYSTIKTPENAKNVLAVGASQNGLSAASHCMGGAGPTSDGRRKPEIFAPGCSIMSARHRTACSTASQSGTSMASPAVTGAGALARQYFLEGWYPSGTSQPGDALNPSGALLRAVLLNSAVDMTNVTGYPSHQEGWGRILLEDALYFAGDLRRLVVLADERNAQGLITGQSVGYALDVTADQEALAVSLVFTEPPAALMASSTTVNNLDLELQSPTGLRYWGNVFSGSFSTTGGVADPINNAEVVRIATPERGTWVVRVLAPAVNQGTQGYALVATGQVAPLEGTGIRYQSHTVQDDPPLGNSNGRLDPGETISLPLTVRNFQAQAATLVSCDLTSGLNGTAQVTEGHAAYPDIPGFSSSTTLAPHYRLTVAPDAVCGSLIPFDLDLHHAGGASESAFNLEVGRSLFQVAAADVPRAIPGTGATTSMNPVNEPLTIGDVNVAVNISHQNVAELLVTLTSPAGTQVTLHSGSGAGANINAIYDAERPVDGPGSMSDFDGEQAQGTWSLMVRDVVSGAPAGTLQAWSLRIVPAGGALCTSASCGSDPVPAEVARTMTLRRENGSDLRLDWQQVPGAASYRIWRSASPDFAAQELAGSASGTSFLDSGGAAGADSQFFLVHAVNSCEWQGP